MAKPPALHANSSAPPSPTAPCLGHRDALNNQGTLWHRCHRPPTLSVPAQVPVLGYPGLAPPPAQMQEAEAANSMQAGTSCRHHVTGAGRATSLHAPFLFAAAFRARSGQVQEEKHCGRGLEVLTEMGCSQTQLPPCLEGETAVPLLLQPRAGSLLTGPCKGWAQHTAGEELWLGSLVG